MIGPKKLIAMIAAHLALLPLTAARSRFARSAQAAIARIDWIDPITITMRRWRGESSLHDFLLRLMSSTVPDASATARTFGVNSITFWEVGFVSGFVSIGLDRHQCSVNRSRG